MNEHKSFVLYTDLLEKIRKCTWEEMGKLFYAILLYENDLDIPEDLPIRTEMALDFILPQLREDRAKWEQLRETRRSSGRMGGQGKTSNSKQNLANEANANFASENLANEANANFAKHTVNVNVTDNVNVNENVNVNKGSLSSEESKEPPEKDISYRDIKKDSASQKHKYGEFNHVLLSDKDRDALMNDYGEELTLECIKYLDEYIEDKGYKSKNHRLAIRRWVIDAVKKGHTKTARSPNDRGGLVEAWEQAAQEPDEQWIWEGQ